MAKAARTLSGELRAQIDKAADASRWSLVIVALLAVGREGLETALFLWAATQTAARGTASTAGPLLGAALGLLVAVLLGYLIYRGALKINLSRFFTWTGAFLIVIAAGVLAYGVHDLQEARFLPGLNNLAFDVSAAIPPTSWYGTLLKGVFNFSPATTVLEAAAWLLYFIPTMTIFLYQKRQRTQAPSRPTPEPVGASGRK
jgi:high-affinity iron transporter